MFNRIDTIEQDKNVELCQRIRILLINLKADRKNNWDKQRKSTDEGPKKVEQLRKEMEMKARLEEE